MNESQLRTWDGSCAEKGSFLVEATMETETTAELWTVKDLAAALKLGRRTIWRMVSTGSIPQPIRLGRSVRWRRATIEAWLAEREAGQ